MIEEAEGLQVVPDEMQVIPEEDVVQLTNEPLEEQKEVLVEESKEEKPKFSEEEKEVYGKRVQKRINDLTSEIYAEKQKNTEWQDKFVNLEKRVYDHESKVIDTENKRVDDDISKRSAELRVNKLKALDEADYESVSKIDDELMDLKVRGARERPKEPVYAEPQPNPQPNIQPMPMAEQDWLQSNDWFHNPSKSAQVAKADGIFKAMLNEGYKRHEDATFTELDRRLNFKQDPAPSPSAPDRGRTTTHKEVKLTKNDLQMLEDMGLDSTDKTVRAAMLKEKRA